MTKEKSAHQLVMGENSLKELRPHANKNDFSLVLTSVDEFPANQRLRLLELVNKVKSDIYYDWKGFAHVIHGSDETDEIHGLWLYRSKPRTLNYLIEFTARERHFVTNWLGFAKIIGQLIGKEKHGMLGYEGKISKVAPTIRMTIARTMSMGSILSMLDAAKGDPKQVSHLFAEYGPRGLVIWS